MVDVSAINLLPNRGASTALLTAGPSSLLLTGGSNGMAAAGPSLAAALQLTAQDAAGASGRPPDVDPQAPPGGDAASRSSGRYQEDQRRATAERVAEFLVKNELGYPSAGAATGGRVPGGLQVPGTLHHQHGVPAASTHHAAAAAALMSHMHVPPQAAAAQAPPPHHLFHPHHHQSDQLTTDLRMHHHHGYASAAAAGGGLGQECLSTQKAVAFLAGPRERIHVLGNPVEHCPRCQQEGMGATGWRPHRHIGELKIRYICERHFDDLESNHHFDIPLCPVCNQVLYLYDFNNMLGVSNARRLHKYVLKCANRHVLPLLDLFCQTKKGGERCNANLKLQWCYGTMVKRCEAQKNRDHDLWWVRYKNEWKQRRTIIRYKKDFLSHLTDAQRSLLLGLGLEGEPPPDPKAALGPAFDILVSAVGGGSPGGPKIKKRSLEGRDDGLAQLDARLGGPTGGHVDAGYGDMHHHPPSKQRYRSTAADYGLSLTDYASMAASGTAGGTGDRDDPTADLRYVMGAVVLPSRGSTEDPGSTSASSSSQLMMYLGQQQQQQQSSAQAYKGGSARGVYEQQPSQQPTGGAMNPSSGGGTGPTIIPQHSIVTGTPTPPLASNGVAVSVVGEVIPAAVIR